MNQPVRHSYFDQDMSVPDYLEIPCGRISLISQRSPGKSTANEDAAGIVSLAGDAAVLILADGMGGHALGDVASRTAVDEVFAAVEQSAASGDLIRTGILNGFERANQAVQALGVGAGTTLSVVEISEHHARPYHTGDSLILIVGGKGRVHLQTTAHSPVGFGLESGLLDNEEALNHESSHVVLNAIGRDDMRIEIGPPVKLARRDTVLLASDGLSDNLPLAQIAEGIRKGPLNEAVEGLATACRKWMEGDSESRRPDDLTMIGFRQLGRI